MPFIIEFNAIAAFNIYKFISFGFNWLNFLKNAIEKRCSNERMIRIAINKPIYINPVKPNLKTYKAKRDRALRFITESRG